MFKSISSHESKNISMLQVSLPIFILLLNLITKELKTVNQKILLKSTKEASLKNKDYLSKHFHLKA